MIAERITIYTEKVAIKVEQESKVKFTKKLLKMGFEIEKIEEATEFSMEEILNFQKEL